MYGRKGHHPGLDDDLREFVIITLVTSPAARPRLGRCRRFHRASGRGS